MSKRRRGVGSCTGVHVDTIYQHGMGEGIGKGWGRDGKGMEGRMEKRLLKGWVKEYVEGWENGVERNEGREGLLIVLSTPVLLDEFNHRWHFPLVIIRYGFLVIGRNEVKRRIALYF